MNPLFLLLALGFGVLALSLSRVKIFNFPTSVLPESQEIAARKAITPEMRDAALRAQGATILGSTPNTVFYRQPEVEVPGYKEARAQTQAIDRERRGIRAEFEMSRNYGPLSESKIAKEIQRIPEFNDKPNAGYVPPPLVYNVPGFIRRPDGLLQWDGKTIPEFMKGRLNDINLDCSQPLDEEDPEGIMCEGRKAEAKNWLDLLRNRPWVPGRDLSQQLYETSSMWFICAKYYKPPDPGVSVEQYCTEIYGRPPKTLNPKLVKVASAHANPRPLRTAEEEYDEKITNMKTGKLSQEKGRISEAAEEAYQKANYPTIGPSYAGEDLSLLEKEEAESRARDAAHKAFVEKTEQETLAKLRSQFGGFVSGSSFRRRRQGGY